MQPGFMCLESGLTRSKNSINVAVKNLADFGISVALFWAFGYAFMFGRSLMGWIGSTGFFLELDSNPELAAFFLFQVMFCSTATTIVSGAVAERLQFRAYLIVALVISGLIYPVFGHWAWSGVAKGTLTGWLGNLGFVDFAGSTVVHSIGAWVALAALLVVGPRTGRFPAKGRPRKIHGSNLPLSVLGAMLLWLGWLGFNGGSTLAFNDRVASIMVHTIVAGVSGMLTALAIGWQQRKSPEVELLINGSLAGLVSITASCNVVTTAEAALIGAIGAAVMLLVSDCLARWRIDDAIDAVAVHGGGGLWGSLAIALFDKPGWLDTDLSKGSQLLVQLLGILVCFVWAFGLTWVLLTLTNRFLPLRVSAEAEQIGLNVSEHRAKTEVYDLFQVMEQQAKTQDLSLRVPVEPFTEVGQIGARYNQVMDALETKNQQIVNYLQQVERVTTAAAAVENDTFQPESLNGVAARPDKLGHLARIFQQMAQQVKAREKRLQQAKKKLAKTNEQLEAVLNAVPGSISWIGEDGLYIGVNRHLAQSWNLSPEAFIGQKVDFLKGNSQLAEFMRQFLDSSEIAASQVIEVGVNGSRRYYLVAAQKYQQGTATVSVGIDVTERKQAEEALRIAEEKYRSIFENALEGIFQVTPDGKYINVNPAMARIYGYESPEQMITSVAEIGDRLYVVPSCRNELKQRLEERGEVKEFEYQVYRRDGSFIWVSESTRAVCAPSGQLFYYEGIVKDITRRKQEEETLKRQLQELRVEIDQQKRVRQVAEITQTDYFQELQADVERLRFDDDFWNSEECH